MVNKLSGDVKILFMLHNLFVNKKSLLTLRILMMKH